MNPLIFGIAVDVEVVLFCFEATAFPGFFACCWWPKFGPKSQSDEQKHIYIASETKNLHQLSNLPVTLANWLKLFL